MGVEKIHFIVLEQLEPSRDRIMLCAIESALRLHPNATIILHAEPVLRLQLHQLLARTILSNQSILNAKGIILRDLIPEEAVIDTPLLRWLASTQFQQSPHKVFHLSDAMRYAILYRFGGVYLDTDMLLLRPINMGEQFLNAAAKQSQDKMNGACSFC
jgi:hypothetical protein